MSATTSTPRILEELSELFASGPTREQLLNYHPSQALQQRASNLLAKQGESWLTAEEKQELDQFLHAEMFMRLVKAKLHAHKAKRP